MLDVFCKKSHTREKCTVLTIVIILFCVLAKIFYCQAVEYNGLYYSDLPAHIRFATTGEGYSILYWLIGTLLSLKNSMFLIAIVESLIVVFTWLISARLMEYLVPSISYLEAKLISLSLTFLTGIYIPYVYESFYKLQLITQPYHNITYYGMRLLAVASLLLFAKMFNGYLKNIKRTYYMAFSLLLMLATWIKPSFFYGFALTLLFYLIFDLIKSKFTKSSFFQIVMMGTTVFPSLLVMYFQAKILYGTGDESSGIAILFGGKILEYDLAMIIMQLICSFAFPCIVGFINRKKMFRIEKFCYIMCAIQYAIAMVFVETGERANAGNFFWGLYIGAYFLFIISVSIFFRNIKEKNAGYRMYKIVGFVLILAHLLSSVLYFRHIYLGGYFLI